MRHSVRFLLFVLCFSAMTANAADDHAGSFRGFVQASDGSFVNVTLAWMRDGATVRTPGEATAGTRQPSGPAS